MTYGTNPNEDTFDFIGPRNKFESKTYQVEGYQYLRHQQSSRLRTYSQNSYTDEFLMTYSTSIEGFDFNGKIHADSFQVRVDAAALFGSDAEESYSTPPSYGQFVVDAMQIELRVYLNDIPVYLPYYMDVSRTMKTSHTIPDNGEQTVWFDAIIQGISIFDNTYITDMYYTAQTINNLMGYYYNQDDIITNSLSGYSLVMGIDYGEDWVGFSNGRWDLGMELDFGLFNLPLNDGDKLTFDIKYTVNPHKNTWLYGFSSLGFSISDTFDYYETFDT